MSFAGGILSDLLGLISGILQLYIYIVFAAVVISWVNADPYNQIVRFIRSITDPVINPVRRKLWRYTAKLQLDFSPMIVIFGIMILQRLIMELRIALAQGVHGF